MEDEAEMEDENVNLEGEEMQKETTTADVKQRTGRPQQSKKVNRPTLAPQSGNDGNAGIGAATNSGVAAHSKQIKKSRRMGSTNTGETENLVE